MKNKNRKRSKNYPNSNYKNKVLSTEKQETKEFLLHEIIFETIISTTSSFGRKVNTQAIWKKQNFIGPLAQRLCLRQGGEEFAMSREPLGALHPIHLKIICWNRRKRRKNSIKLKVLYILRERSMGIKRPKRPTKVETFRVTTTTAHLFQSLISLNKTSLNW